MDEVVWLAMRWNGFSDLSILGVMDSEERAIDLCFDNYCLVGPLRFNKKLSEEATSWPGAYYYVEEEEGLTYEE